MTSQQGSTGSRRGSEIGKEHCGEIAEGCLRVLQNCRSSVEIKIVNRGTNQHVGH